MMLEQYFEKVSYDNIEIIKEYLYRYPRQESNHNLLNIYLWLSLYPLYFFKDDDSLVLIGSYHSQYFSYMPLCQKGKEFEIILKVKKIFESLNLPFQMMFIDEYLKEELKKHFDNIIYRELDEHFDYIYDLALFKSFKGKKLQKKRNHLNHFYKLYDGRYKFNEIDEDNLEDVKEFVRKIEAKTEYAIHEKIGILSILDHLHHFDIKSGLIYIDGTIKGLMMVSKLDDMMIQENIEKADKNIPGLYQALIYEFFKYHQIDTIYLNREDDLGIEGLKKAKESYHPIKYIRKYQIQL